MDWHRWALSPRWWSSLVPMGSLLLHGPHQQTELSFKMELGLQPWCSRVRQVIHFSRARASVSLQIFSNLGAIQIWPKKPCPEVSWLALMKCLTTWLSRRLAASCVILANFFFLKPTALKPNIFVFKITDFFSVTFFSMCFSKAVWRTGTGKICVALRRWLPALLRGSSKFPQWDSCL